jgi:hypothetical protein
MTKRRALIAKACATVRALGGPDSIYLRKSVVLIGEQREVQRVLVAEPLALYSLREDPIATSRPARNRSGCRSQTLKLDCELRAERCSRRSYPCDPVDSVAAQCAVVVDNE